MILGVMEVNSDPLKKYNASESPALTEARSPSQEPFNSLVARMKDWVLRQNNVSQVRTTVEIDSSISYHKP